MGLCETPIAGSIMLVQVLAQLTASTNKIPVLVLTEGQIRLEGNPFYLRGTIVCRSAEARGMGGGEGTGTSIHGAGRR